MWKVSLTTAVLLGMAVPAFAQPVPVPIAQAKVAIQNMNDQRKVAKENQKKWVSALKVSGKYKLSDIVRFNLKDGLLQAEWTGALMTVQPIRIEIEGSKAMWVVQQPRVLQQPNVPNGMTIVNLAFYDFERPDEEGPYMINLNINNKMLNLGANFGPGTDVYAVSYVQVNNTAQMNWTIMQNGQFRAGGNMSAPTLLQLRADHPEDVRKTLEPVFRDLTGVNWLRPGVADVYRAFDGIQPDMKVVEKVNEILPRLDSLSFPERETASAELAALAAPGVLAAVRIDQDPLSPEQRNRITAFLTEYTRRSYETPTAARQDLNFVLESLEDADVVVRTAAKEAIEALTHHKVGVDVALTGDKLTAAVNAYRADLAKQPPPAPATQPNAPSTVQGAFNQPVN